MFKVVQSPTFLYKELYSIGSIYTRLLFKYDKDYRFLPLHKIRFINHQVIT